MNAKDWIQNEDQAARLIRTERLQWLLDNTPQNEIWLFHAGYLNYELFEQTRYCFVYGQDLAVILLGLSVIEHTLAALLFASGRDELDRASLTVLVEEAYKYQWITDAELEVIEKTRKIRNNVTHFRKPTDKASFEMQTELNEEAFLEIITKDAKQILIIIFLLVNIFSPMD